MLSVGVDITELQRIKAVVARWGPRFLHRIYTADELVYCRGAIPELAARFAAKEAISKALGTGIVGISWREMEILPNTAGKPLVALYGRALARAEILGLSEWAISLSHTDRDAIALVVATDH